VREASGGAGDSRVEEDAGGGATGKAVLYFLYSHLAALTAAAPATRRWRSQRSLAQRLQGWLCSWHQLRVCPVCYLWREQEQLYLHALLEDWQEPELAQAFAASSGLCWLHTLHLVEQGGQHAHLQAVLAAQQAHLQRLQDELHEFIRKPLTPTLSQREREPPLRRKYLN
jgi:hypothetical protein